MPHLIGVTNMLPMSYGGFLYLYVRSFTRLQPHQLKWRDLTHFAGLFFVLAINLPHFFSSADHKLQLVTDILNNNAPWNIQILYWLIPAYASIYAIYSGVLLWRSHQLVHFIGSRLLWLKIILILNLSIWLAALASALIPERMVNSSDEIIYIIVSLLIYLLGYFSLRQPEIFISPKEAAPKYGENRLPDHLRAQIFQTLDKYMKEHTPWRDMNLNINQLADRTGIATHHLSQVLNDHLGQSFAEYLNQYRVRAVCEQLTQSNDQTLLDIALDCGFSSKSTFNAMFKKQTGKTPSEYRKQLKSSS